MRSKDTLTAGAGGLTGVVVFSSVGFSSEVSDGRVLSEDGALSVAFVSGFGEFGSSFLPQDTAIPQARKAAKSNINVRDANRFITQFPFILCMVFIYQNSISRPSDVIKHTAWAAYGGNSDFPDSGMQADMLFSV